MGLLNKVRLRNLQATRLATLGALKGMISKTSKPRVKAMYRAVERNVKVVPINFRRSDVLSRTATSATQGVNVKRIVYKNEMPVVQSAINLPINHIFRGNKITYDGLLTLLHEYSHVILPSDARRFTQQIFGNIRGDAIDEFMADLIMTRIAHKLRVPSKRISKHMYRRFGAHPGVKLILDLVAGKDVIKESRRRPVKLRRKLATRRRKSQKAYRGPSRGFTKSHIAPRVMGNRMANTPALAPRSPQTGGLFPMPGRRKPLFKIPRRK